MTLTFLLLMMGCIVSESLLDIHRVPTTWSVLPGKDIGFGEVHQAMVREGAKRIPSGTWKSCVEQSPCCDVEIMVKGVVWNDMPDGDPDNEEVVEVRDSAGKKHTCKVGKISHLDMAGQLIRRALGLPPQRDSEASMSLTRRQYHAMQLETDEPVAVTNRQIQRQLSEWYVRSRDTPKLRPDMLGRILHMIQDSYAKGHTIRKNEDGRIEKFMFYEADTPRQKKHVEYDSWKHAFGKTKSAPAAPEAIKAISDTSDTMKDWIELVIEGNTATEDDGFVSRIMERTFSVAE